MGSSHSYHLTSGENVFAATGRRKKSFVLEKQKEFPLRIQIAIAEVGRRKQAKNPKVFLGMVQNALADWLFEAATSQSAECGPDDERDTPQQMELALRFFPEVLKMRRYGLFPIMWLSKSMRSVSFIPLFARLGIELNLFQDSERGGLVFGSNGMDVFSQLAASRAEDGAEGKIRRDDEAYQNLVDETFLKVLRELRKDDLMTSKDIRAFKMIDLLCAQAVFPEQRFRYLIDWNPSVLLSNNKVSGKTVSMRLITRFFDKQDIGGLKMLFELSMKYYPVELGFLFDTMYSVEDEKSFRKKPSSFRKKKHKSNKKRLAANNNDDMNQSDHSRSDHSRSSTISSSTRDRSGGKQPLFEESTSLFQFACETYGKEDVEKLVDSMVYGQIAKDADFTRKAIVHAAALPEEDAPDTVYMLLQKDPTALLRRDPAAKFYLY